MIRLEEFLAVVVVVVAIAVGGWFALEHYGTKHYEAGYAAAVAERAQAVLDRASENKAKAAQQALYNIDITKEKDHEIADLHQRLAAAGRLRVGTAVCPDRSAANASTESPSRSNGPDPSAGLVSAAADRDFKQLIVDVEQDLATGRACQAFLLKNGLVP